MIFLLAVQAFEVILRYDFALSKTAKSCQSSLLSSLMKYLSMTRESVAHFALACSPGRSKVRVSWKEVTLLLMSTCPPLETRNQLPQSLTTLLSWSPSTCYILFIHVIIFLLHYSYSYFPSSLWLPVILSNKLQLNAVPCACLYNLSTDIMMSEAEQKNNYHFLSDYIQQMSEPTCGGG